MGEVWGYYVIVGLDLTHQTMMAGGVPAGSITVTSSARTDRGRNKAGLRLTLDDGTDLADRIDPRLLELTLVEKRGGEADELSLTLHNHDGQLGRLPPGARFTSRWAGERRGCGPRSDRQASRVEVEERGPPDIIQIRARSADFTGPPASAG
jgi:hypothetical protein